jgi:lipopolysaccharide/colanic/teichoic acid biosynthesis glycosyltransferase
MNTITTPKRREEDRMFYLVGSSDFSSRIIYTDITHNPSLFYCASKRLLDIVIATLGIVALLPVFLVIAVCIKLEDGGDILYFREMVGVHGRRFVMLKFRTMIPRADTYLEQHPKLKLAFQENMKLQHDPRITRTGRFLRKVYLDELPQLFNVLAGHMSLVGPRAIHQRELILYGEYAEKRHSVKPGMTGLWQISPDRHRCYEERIPLDMQYIDDGSLFLDLVILLKTLKVCVIPTGV